ncbi:hypothetical protein [Cellvibrio sp. QJXJ]|uniref:hypothetical protein n=1 Tax=Cellvibrio sp. QJXJ TaxID=2964606 RepID=UPI0021C31BAB|nr:hypothetical protein [Cellvibrio sp. QJXJ]UUA71350.1 hypothetical protein NNX04_13115 [Cellvibrio sp. QJXJ]
MPDNETLEWSTYIFRIGDFGRNIASQCIAHENRLRNFEFLAFNAQDIDEMLLLLVIVDAEEHGAVDELEHVISWSADNSIRCIVFVKKKIPENIDGKNITTFIPIANINHNQLVRFVCQLARMIEVKEPVCVDISDLNAVLIGSTLGLISIQPVNTLQKNYQLAVENALQDFSKQNLTVEKITGLLVRLVAAEHNSWVNYAGAEEALSAPEYTNCCQVICLGTDAEMQSDQLELFVLAVG